MSRKFEKCKSFKTSEHVEVGTEIHTDIWKGYRDLENLGYTHKKVNNK